MVEDRGDGGTDRKRGGHDETHGKGDGGSSGSANMMCKGEEGVGGAEGGAKGGGEESEGKENDGSCSHIKKLYIYIYIYIYQNYICIHCIVFHQSKDK